MIGNNSKPYFLENKFVRSIIFWAPFIFQVFNWHVQISFANFVGNILLRFVIIVLFFPSGPNLSAKLFPMVVIKLLKNLVRFCVKEAYFCFWESLPKLLIASRKFFVRVPFVTKNCAKLLLFSSTVACIFGKISCFLLQGFFLSYQSISYVWEPLIFCPAHNVSFHRWEFF